MSPENFQRRLQLTSLPNRSPDFFPSPAGHVLHATKETARPLHLFLVPTDGATRRSGSTLARPCLLSPASHHGRWNELRRWIPPPPPTPDAATVLHFRPISLRCPRSGYDRGGCRLPSSRPPQFFPGDGDIALGSLELSRRSGGKSLAGVRRGWERGASQTRLLQISGCRCDVTSHLLASVRVVVAHQSVLGSPV
jgi:hypothetical protein